MLLENVRRLGLAAAVAAILAVLYAGCSDQSVHYASDSGSSAGSARATPQPTPNPDQAAGLITRFYRDTDNAATADLRTVVSSDFIRNHHDNLVTDYGFIHEPKIQIQNVHGRVVSYAMDYAYVSDKGGKFLWERSGRWTLNHGAATGWVLDNDTWDSIHLVGIQLPNQTSVVPVRDTVFHDGRHEFTYEGARFSFSANESGWQVTAISAPTSPPTPVPDRVADTTTAYATTADTTTADSTTTDSTTTDSTTTDSTDTAVASQTHFDDAQNAQEKCPNDVVVWVNTRSGIFHLPGTRWYGMTESGAYECESDAFAEGDRQSRNGQ